MRRRRVAVVGGGISGLATAYFLTHRDDALPGEPPLEVTVLESTDRLGGKILTREVGGLPIDAGPDAILARSPVLVRLLTDLDLLPRLSRVGRGRAFVWARGALRPLPPSSLFGVPDTPLPLLRSGLLSPWGALRAGADFILPRRSLPADPTIAELLRPRFGREVFDQLVEPLLGGVHAGRADALSARSAVPEVYRAARANRSTYLALRQRRAARGRSARSGSGSTGSAAGSASSAARLGGLGMVSLQGGLATLVQALTDALPDVRLRTGATVTGIEPGPEGVELTIDGSERLRVDAVVLSTPAFVSSRLLAPLSRPAAAALAEIPYVGVATVTLAYRREDVGRELDGTGFLVPPVDGRLIVGCTWSSVKWEHLASEELAVFRCAVGRHGDQRWQEMPDQELVARVDAELAGPMQLAAAPQRAVVQRWPDAMPQYTVGHEHRLVTLARELHRLPGVHLTGAAFRGVGISGCVVQAADVSDAVLAQLRGTASNHPAGTRTGQPGSLSAPGLRR